jgi:hypothetical protein
MYKTLLLCVTSALLLQGCGKGPYTTKLENNYTELLSSFEIEYADARKLHNDIHKASGTKYFSASKKEILQASLAALLDLGFHINNQDMSLGILSGTTDGYASFLGRDVFQEDRLYKEKLISIIYQQYDDTLNGENIASIISSELGGSLRSILANVLVIERKNDSQVAIKITYTINAKVSSESVVYPRRDLISMGIMTEEEVPGYILPPALLEIIYKRVWEAVEKQLFQQDIILNR